MASQLREEDVQLLSAWPSAYVMRVKAALAAKEVPYAEIPQDLGPNSKSELLLKSNPVYKKVPVLIQQGKPVCESMVIAEYIEEAFTTGHPLLPKDTYQRANARFWADFCDKKVFPAIVKILKSNGADELKAAQEEAKDALGILDRAFAHETGPFFGGSHVGLVDVVMAPVASWGPAVEALVGVGPLVECEELPFLQRWMQTFHSSAQLAPCQSDHNRLTDYAKRFRPSA